MSKRPNPYPGYPEQIAPDVYVYAGYTMKRVLTRRKTGGEIMKWKIVEPSNSDLWYELREYGILSIQDLVALVEWEHRRLWDEVERLDAIARKTKKNQS